MAKFGDGDARWIVEDREDGRNVHNWHWTETDCMGWATKRAGDLFSNLVLLDSSEGDTLVSTTGVDSITGEAFVNMRKGKLISTYELEMRIRWSGEMKNNDGEVKGKGSGTLHLPYLGVENHGEEPEIRVLVEQADSTSSQLKEIVRTKAKKKFLDTLSTFLDELKAGGPAQQAGVESTKPESEPDVKNGAKTNAVPSAQPEQCQDASLPVKKLGKQAKHRRSSKGKREMTEQFYASPRDLYECFTNAGKLQAFTQSTAKVENRVGGEFSWFNGSVSGRFKELEENKKIIMDWRFNTWDEDSYSQVVLQFESPEEGTTIVTVRQTGIPESDRYGNEDVLTVTENGWRGQVFHKIRAIFGYGI